jgi:hypothetical protein
MGELTATVVLAVLDAIRERKPPFSPEDVVQEFADLMRRYGISRVVGDRYGGTWVAEAFARRHITYEPAAKSKSELYSDLLPLLNFGTADLLNDDRLIGQLVGLERKTARGGRDSIDHAPGGHDDLANAVAGVLVNCGGGKSQYNLDILVGDEPPGYWQRYANHLLTGSQYW